MEKLQYDSFYKFIVSISVVLIVAPVLLLHFWISGSYDVTISQQEFECLTKEAANLMSRKMVYMDVVFSILPFAFIIAEAFGVLLFVWGCYKWYSIQMYLDKMSELDVREKDYRLQQMSLDEKIEKIAEETKEDIDSQMSETENTDDRIVKSIKIERLCYDKLRNKLGKNYKLHRNVKIENCEYDIVAYSRKDNLDIIYEIKNWKKLVSKTLLDRICEKMSTAEATYENSVHRNKHSILLIVSNAEVIEQMKEYKFDEFVRERYNIEMEFMEESSLYSRVYSTCYQA